MAGPAKRIKIRLASQDSTYLKTDSIQRIIIQILLALLVGVLSWVFAATLEYTVAYLSEHLISSLKSATSPNISKNLIIVFLVIIVASICRAYLGQLKSWKAVEGDGATEAITYFLESYRLPPEKTVRERMKRSTLTGGIKRIIVTILTLGLGGSGGLEGPVIPVGESVGAFICRFFRIKDCETLRALQMAGIAGAVCTLLNAPLAAVVFSSEVVYSERIIYRTFLYSIFSVAVADALNQLFFHPTFLFNIISHTHHYTGIEYIQVVAVAIFCSAPTGIGITLCFDQLKKIFNPIKWYLRAPIAMVLAYVVALLLWTYLHIDPIHVIGIGETTIRDLLTGSGGPMIHIWWGLIIIIIAKTFTTGLTLASGGSAGKLIPAMILGGTMGAAVFHILFHLNFIPEDDFSIFVISGVASSLVAILEVPIATIVLIMELFGANFTSPAMIAVGICHLVASRLKFYVNSEKKSDNSVSLH